MYTGMPLNALSGPAGCRGLPGRSQSLTLAVEDGYFTGLPSDNPNRISHSSPREVPTFHQQTLACCTKAS